MSKILRFHLMGLMLVLCSCSHFSLGRYSTLNNEILKFNFTDQSGTYQIVYEIGVAEKKKEVFVKTQLLPENGDESKALEKSIAISQFGQLKNKGGKVNVLRPKISQYTVWLDGQKFFSQLKTDFDHQKLEIILVSPEKKWQGKSSFALPQGEHVFCFYSQVVECIKVTDFIKLSMEKKVGKMNFKLIWDNDPYMQEHYHNLPSEVLSDAEFIYDGEMKDGIVRYILKVENQTIFYHFDKKQNFLKKFWISQGISQVKL